MAPEKPRIVELHTSEFKNRLNELVGSVSKGDITVIVSRYNSPRVAAISLDQYQLFCEIEKRLKEGDPQLRAIVDTLPKRETTAELKAVERLAKRDIRKAEQEGRKKNLR